MEIPTGTKGAATLRQRAASLVPAGISNRYQWKPKAPVEKSGVLSRGQWSRLWGTGWETGGFGLSQPVPKARFLVVEVVAPNIQTCNLADWWTAARKIFQRMDAKIFQRMDGGVLIP